MTPERAEAALGGGPYTAAEARDAGLVDRLAYRDEVEARALARAGVGAGLVPMSEYLDAERGEPGDGATRVAFVRAVGTIQRGSEALGGGVAADDLAQALTEAIDDPAVRAIVLRIASPGGSAVASETIAHQVRQAVKVGKPVIVSMGNVAASGGYWIAMDASRIVAEPLTLTGSIGVFAGKPVLAGASEKLGINWGRATAGPDLGMWSLDRALHGSGPGAARRARGRSLRHLQGRRGPRPASRPGGGGGPGPGSRVDRRRGARAQARRPAGRARRGPCRDASGATAAG